MITENLINKFISNNYIINEDLHLPHGTKSAKVVIHTDLDGASSGISLVNQLVKQGIPKDRITIEFAQYGDDKKEKDAHTEKFIGKKDQYVGAADFAKIPKAKPWDIFNKLMNFKGNKSLFVNFMKSRNFSNMSQEDFSKLVLSTFNIQKNKWTDGNLKALYNALKRYSSMTKKPDINFNNIETLSYPLAEPDFVSDHHDNSNGALSGGKTGEIATGSPSEAEFFADKYSPGMWSQQDLKAVSMVDSAGYNKDQLTNTVFLEKHFSGPDKNKNLATIISCVYDNMVKKDRQAAKWVIKNAGPNLVSLYSATLKAAGFNGRRLEYVSALKEGNVDKAKEMLSQIPDELNKLYDRKGNPEKPVMTLDKWKAKNLKDLERNKTGYKTKADDKKIEDIKGKRGEEFRSAREEINSKKGSFRIYNNFMMQEATLKGGHIKNYPTRYMGSVLSKDGKRAPYTLKRYGDFIQVSKNPLCKGDVDFAEVSKHVMPEIKSAMLRNGISEFNVNRIMSDMMEQNGGHKAIYSFQGFDEIKPTGKELGDKYWTAKRVLKKNPKSELAGKIVNKYDTEVVNPYKDKLKNVMDTAVASLIKWTNKLYPVDQEKLNDLNNSDERFEMNK